MNITLTWNDFKMMNPYQGTQLVFVKDITDGVTKAAVLCTSRSGVIYLFTNPPTKNQFLARYPGAFQVNDII